MVGGTVFWMAAIATLAVVLICFFATRGRVWAALAVLLMWSAFSIANAIRSRRVHSIVSAPVYLAAALALAAAAAGRIDVQVWMIWVLGAGMIAANLSERLFGKYL